MRYKSEDVTQSGDYTVLDVSSLSDYTSDKAVRIDYLIVQNASGNTQKIIVKHGTVRVMAVETELRTSGIARQFQPPMVLPPNTDLVLNASTADAYSYTVEYEYV